MVLDLGLIMVAGISGIGVVMILGAVRPVLRTVRLFTLRRTLNTIYRQNHEEDPES